MTLKKTVPCPSCGGPMHPLAQHSCRACTRAKDKFCSGCARTLPRSAFYQRPDGHGLFSRCKECNRAAKRKWKTSDAGREKTHAQKRASYRRHREAIRARASSPDKLAHRVAEAKVRKAKDIHFRIRERLRSSLATAARAYIFKKQDTTFSLLGCTLSEFQAHIEAQWQQGMSWDNWGRGVGKWNIDHIRPVASFDLTLLEHQRECFHFTNMQPLWATENVRKGAKWDGGGTP